MKVLLIILLLTGILGSWWFFRDSRKKETIVEKLVPSPAPTSSGRQDLVEISAPLSAIRDQAKSKVSSHALATLLDALPDTLTPAETEWLLTWLEDSSPEDYGGVSKHAHLVNEVLNLFHRQAQPPHSLAKIVIGLAQNEAKNDLIRDYAVQHLRIAWQGSSRKEMKKRIEEVLWRAVEENHATRTGTALLALHNLGEKKRVSETFARVLSDDMFDHHLRAALTISDHSASSRMAAIRVASERHLNAFAGKIRDLASDSSLSLPERLSAIAALGRIGQIEDRSLLKSLSENPQFAKAAQLALRHLSSPSL